MSLDYWYDDGYGYGYDDYLSVDGLSGLFGGLFDGLFSDDSYYGGYDDYGYDYDYGYGWDDGEVISVDSYDSLYGSGDYGLLDSIFGLFDGTLSTDGYSGLLGGLFDALFTDEYSYGGYDDYGYDYEGGYDEVISVDSSDALSDLSGLSGLDSILGLLGGSELSLSTDDSASALSGLDLSSILGLLGGSDLNLSTDDSASALSGLDLSSVLGLLGGSGLSLSTDDSASALSGLDLSSILGLLGGSGANVSVDGSTAASSAVNGIDLTSILGLLGGSGSSLSADGLSGLGNALSGLASIYGGISNLGTSGDSATWDDLDFLDNLNNILPNVSGGTVSSSGAFDLSSILSLLGGSTGTSVSVDGSTASASTGLDLSSILSLLGGSTGANASVEGSTASGTGIDLSSIISQLNNSGTSVSVEGSTASGTGIDLSSIISQLNNSGANVSVEGSTTSSTGGLNLSSILGLLGGSGSSLSADGLSGLGNALSGLASIYGGISNLGTSGDSATWDDLDFLDNLNNILPNVSGGTVSSSGAFDLSSILGLLGGSTGTSVSVEGGTASSTGGLDLTSILGLLGGSGLSLSTDSSASALSGLDLSSILGLLGGSGLSLSTDSSASASAGLDLSSILGLLGGSGLNLSTDSSASASAGLDLSSILGLLGGSGLNLSTDSSASASIGLDLTSILGLLGGSGLNLSTDSSASALSGLDLSSILGLLGGSGLSLSTDENLFDSASIKDLLDKLTNGDGSFGFDISLSVGDSETWSHFEGLLSHFVETVTADFGSLIPASFAAPEMTVSGLMQTAMDLASGFESSAGTFLDDVLTVTAPFLSWGDKNDAAAQGYWVEIAQGTGFDDAIRIFTTGTSFDIDGSAGLFSGRAALSGSDFLTDAVEWITEVLDPRQIVSNANGLADIFLASPLFGDVWSFGYRASNDLTGETASIAGRNRIRDTFSGSTSDANILYLTDDANGDAIFVDDIYSEFGSDARLSLIREIRSGAGDDVVDMTSGRYTAELAGMTVRGGSGDDVLWGANGGGMLFGDDGDDRITGGSGNDIIAGGSGDDVLNGGGGSDLFTFGENWGDDVISQIAGGSVELWFAEDASQISAAELDGSVIFRNAAGTSSVTVENAALADLKVHFGNDQSACFAGLAAAGAFLGSTAESVFETQAARSQGILASL